MFSINLQYTRFFLLLSAGNSSVQKTILFSLKRTYNFPNDSPVSPFVCDYLLIFQSMEGFLSFQHSKLILLTRAQASCTFFADKIVVKEAEIHIRASTKCNKSIRFYKRDNNNQCLSTKSIVHQVYCSTVATTK